MRTLLSIILSSAISIYAAAQTSLEVGLLPGEKWYGGATDLGIEMPFASDHSPIDLRTTNYNNQTTPLLVSSKGRYIWADGPLHISFCQDKLNVRSHRGEISLGESSGGSLRSAYAAATEKYLRPDGGLPPEEFFVTPIYNTWIELMYDQNQEDVMKYAHALIDNGFPAGVLMIDDNWQKDYGDFSFRPDRFPDPKGMVRELHDMGFKVMLWVSPFVSADSKEARDLNDMGYLLKNHDGDMAVLRWWNGYSACYDLSNPAAYACLKSRLTSLQDNYGIDGFKFDAGDPENYLEEKVKVADGRSFDTEQTRLWANLAMEFPFNELRACWQMGNQPLVQRLGDKHYSWSGVERLVPSMIAAGLLGHSYACPDMIGGGEYRSFLNADPDKFDPTLIVRSCQIHAMMPMMQFSVAPWRILNKECLEICKDYARLHCEMAPYIMEMAAKAAVTGEPIVRHMAYEFPDEGFEEVKDQYMLGDRWMIAPVMTSDNSRKVKLPKGRWRDDTGRVYKGECEITLSNIPLSRLPRFQRL